VKPPVRDTVTTTSCLDGCFPRLIDKLTRVPLLMLDDFGTHNRPAALLPVRNHRGTPSAKIHPDHRPPTPFSTGSFHNAHRIDSMRKQQAAPLLTGAKSGEINHPKRNKAPEHQSRQTVRDLVKQPSGELSGIFVRSLL
jgi:hypothetical protein